MPNKGRGVNVKHGILIGCAIIPIICIFAALLLVAAHRSVRAEEELARSTEDLSRSDEALAQAKTRSHELRGQVEQLQARVRQLEALVAKQAKDLAALRETRPAPARKEELAHLNHGLVGWWRFDEDGGEVAEDFSGQGNHVMLLGRPKRAPGKLGKALLLDGVDDGVLLRERAPDGFMHDGFLARSITFWVRQEEAAREGALFDEGGGTTGLAIRLGPKGLRVGCRSADNAMTLPTVGPLKLKTWYHVALTFNHGEIRLYVNGQRVVEGKAPFAELGLHNDDGMFGAVGRSDALGHADVGGLHFAGMLDDARIYGRALSAREVHVLAGGGGLEPPPVQQPAAPVPPPQDPVDVGVF